MMFDKFSAEVLAMCAAVIHPHLQGNTQIGGGVYWII